MAEHPIYEIIKESLYVDVKQMEEEGHDTNELEKEVDNAMDKGSLDALVSLQLGLWERPSPPDFPYKEPNTWAEISATFPDPDLNARVSYGDETLRDKIHAAWLGRCAGCQLGKPLEGVKFPRIMKRVLKASGSWPLSDYMNTPPGGIDLEGYDIAKAVLGSKNMPRWVRGGFNVMPADDDTYYTLIGLMILEKYGVGFTSEQALATLIKMTPNGNVYASGKNMFEKGAFGIPVSHTGIFGNNFRQSLGAMIRCDPFGWAAPGDPVLAAEMAYRDAINSQRRNGIYAGVFFAVLLADTLAHSDPVKAIDTALKYVPPTSRFAEMVVSMKEACQREKDWEVVNKEMQGRYPKESKSFNHSVTNAAIVIMALLKGEGNFTKTIGTAVMAGLDTDCTGATTGSIMGCALGTEGIPSYWTEPFNDTMEIHMKGITEVKISETADRMYEISRKNVRG